MKSLSAKEAKYGFGRLIDLARAAPVAILKHGRPVVVVMAIEEFERLKAANRPAGEQGVPSRSVEEM
jgi:prevent-host-death family protein